MTTTSFRAVALAAALLLAGCAGSPTRFVATWKAPDSAPLALRPGDLVVAMVISRSESTRRTEEDILARELAQRGLHPIPSYTLVPTDQVMDRQKALAAIQASGAVAVFVGRPIAVSTQQTFVPPSYVAMPYGAWGGYYGYGWGMATSPGYVVTDTVVRVELLVYDLKQDRLLWAGQSETVNPDRLDAFIADLVQAATAQMTREGVLVASS